MAAKKKPKIMMTPETEKVFDQIEKALVRRAEKIVALLKKTSLDVSDRADLMEALGVLDTLAYDGALAEIISDYVDLCYPGDPDYAAPGTETPKKRAAKKRTAK